MLKFDDDVEYKSPFIQRLPLRGRQNKKIGAGRALFTNEKLQFFFGASSADFIKVHQRRACFVDKHRSEPTDRRRLRCAQAQGARSARTVPAKLPYRCVARQS